MKEPLSLHQAILATIRYFDILGFPLTLPELASYLYGWSAPKEAIEMAIGSMQEIAHLHGFYVLKGREEIVKKRQARLAANMALQKKAKRWAWALALCPFVRMASVCNTVAYGNASEASDIDLFIVTADKRLGTARFFMKLLTQLFGLRVYDEYVAGRFCLSFFVMEKAMNLEPLAYPFDPHLAYFVLCMKPLFGQKTYEEFLEVNQEWTARYFKKQLPFRLDLFREHPLSRVFQWCLEKILAMFGGSCEKFFTRWLEQREERYLKKYKRIPGDTSRVINHSVFKFHEHDPRRDIAQKFQEFDSAQ